MNRNFLQEEMLFDTGRSALTRWVEAQGYSRIFFLTDENTRRDCYPRIHAGLQDMDSGIYTVPPGEQSKSLEECESIWRFLLGKGVDRDSLLINLGGGVVCDLGGFCAGTILRGIDFVHVPTSLLAMVDAAIGGKTGIDFDEGKNLIGLFTRPSLVFIWTDFLQTLDERHIRSGMAEMTKHALLERADAWSEYFESAMKGSLEWKRWIRKSVEFKSGVVARDFKERKFRQILNLGHTVAHAIESTDSGGEWLHGEAVWAGLWCAVYLSENRLDSSLPGLRSQMTALCRRYIPGKSIPLEKLDKVQWDKKRRNDSIQMVLLDKVGEAVWPVELSLSQIRKAAGHYNRAVAR